MDLKTYNRETYNLLTFIGDIGGVLDGMLFIGEFFVGPFATIALQ